MTQGFKEEVNSLMNFNTPAAPHKDIIHNQEKDTTRRSSDLTLSTK